MSIKKHIDTRPRDREARVLRSNSKLQQAVYFPFLPSLFIPPACVIFQSQSWRMIAKGGLLFSLSLSPSAPLVLCGLFRTDVLEYKKQPAERSTALFLLLHQTHTHASNIIIMRFPARFFQSSSSRRHSMDGPERQPRRSSFSRIFEEAANTIRRRSFDVFALDSSSVASSFSSSSQHHVDFDHSSCLLSPTSREFEALIVEHPTRTVRFSVTPNYAA